MDIIKHTVFELADKLKQREITSHNAVNAYALTIREKDKSLNAYITICEETAFAEAAIADKMIADGRGGPLAGVPIALKDNISTKGILTTCGSRILGNYVPVFDSTVVTKLKNAGAVIMGKTNMDEFAMGSSTETSFKGPTRNPIDPDKIPGGSSGGSAAVVAAKTAPAALGSDTGGSIRQPAACCGIVGLKPTYGRVSRYGLVAFASSLDQIGPLTRDVRDSALILSVISGHDPMDSTSSSNPVPDYLGMLDAGVKGLKIGMPKEYFAEGLNPEIKYAVVKAIDLLKSNGATVEEMSLPHTEYAVATYYIVATAEASSNLARYDGVKYGFSSPDADTLKDLYVNTRSMGFGMEVKRRIMLGNYVLSSGYYDAYYKKAQRVRSLLTQDFKEAFKKYDAIVCPTMPSPPYSIGEKIDDPLSMYLGDIYTTSVNLAGLPGLTVPFGNAGGLPVGVQLIGPWFGEGTLFRMGRVLEQC